MLLGLPTFLSVLLTFFHMITDFFLGGIFTILYEKKIVFDKTYNRKLHRIGVYVLLIEKHYFGA